MTLLAKNFDTILRLESDLSPNCGIRVAQYSDTIHPDSALPAPQMEPCNIAFFEISERTDRKERR